MSDNVPDGALPAAWSTRSSPPSPAIVLLPLCLLIASAVALDSGGGVIFTQVRVGKGRASVRNAAAVQRHGGRHGIGPRPLVPVEDAIVSRVWAERSNELPGITGAWQVGRSEQTTVAELIQLDQAYLAHRSARRDLTVVARTLWCVVSGRGR